MADITAKDIFEKKIPERLKKNPDVAQKINSTYQFDLTGDGGGEWYVDLTKPDGGEVAAGKLADPKVVVTMTSKDFVDLASGKLNGQMAFMTGKLKIKGDMSLALKLQQILG